MTIKGLGRVLSRGVVDEFSPTNEMKVVSFFDNQLRKPSVTPPVKAGFDFEDDIARTASGGLQSMAGLAHRAIPEMASEARVPASRTVHISTVDDLPTRPTRRVGPYRNTSPSTMHRHHNAGIFERVMVDEAHLPTTRIPASDIPTALIPVGPRGRSMSYDAGRVAGLGVRAARSTGRRVGNLGRNIGGAFGGMGDAAWAARKNLGRNIGSAFGGMRDAAWAAGKNLGRNIGGAFGGMGDAAWAARKNLGRNIGSAFNTMSGAVSGAGRGLGGRMASGGRLLGSSASGLARQVGPALSSMGSIIGSAASAGQSGVRQMAGSVNASVRSATSRLPGGTPSSRPTSGTGATGTRAVNPSFNNSQLDSMHLSNKAKMGIAAGGAVAIGAMAMGRNRNRRRIEQQQQQPMSSTQALYSF